MEMIITPNHAHWGHRNSECWVESKEEQWEAEWPVLLCGSLNQLLAAYTVVLCGKSEGRAAILR